MAKPEFEPGIWELMLGLLNLFSSIIASQKEDAGRHSSSATCWTPRLSDCPTGSSATRGEVIMHPRKAENVLCTLSAWEGITSNSAVLEQVSGKPLSHDGRALTQPGRLQPPGRGLSLLRVGVQGKADRREGSGRRGSWILGFLKWKVATS